MSQNTRQEVLTQMLRRYLRAGRHYKSQLVSKLVLPFSYHRRARWSVPFNNGTEAVSKTSAF
jgi:hypothetical protein